ncbi:MAG: Jag N-terminal domain-containing protein [Acidimicrobiia bacterium]|nr:Jag N-terminal domain-containing protein [Acidimicrobiia bacterium]
MDWVEVRGNSVEVAVEAALAELGLSSRDEANIEIVEEPSRGFLGMGSREALVRVSAKPKTEKRQRRRKRGNGRDRGGDGRSDKRGGQKSGDRQQSGGNRQQGGGRGGNRSGQRSGQSGGRERTQRKPAEKNTETAVGQGRSPRQEQRKPRAKERTMDEATTPEVEIDAEGQAAVVAEFLNGLLDSFGLDGDVSTSVDDDLIIADVAGEQTEALIGPKGSIMQSVGELTRTVVQRKTHRRARLRLDVGGYQERRREALRIYTSRLAEQVLDDGGEIMLEPMNPADRKTVHDAVVDIEGVSSFSEGEEPNRSVVIALAPGVEPRLAGEAGESADTDTDADADESDESADSADEGTEAAGDSDDE